MKPFRNSACFLSLLVVILTGCGGGGSGGSSPTPTPSPTNATGLSPVTATVAGETVDLSWAVPADIPVRSIVEYHIYRDNQIIGTAPAGVNLFADGPPAQGAHTVTWERANGLALIQTSSLAPALTAGVLHSYQITALYQSVSMSITGQTSPGPYIEVNAGTAAFAQVP